MRTIPGFSSYLVDEDGNVYSTRRRGYFKSAREGGESPRHTPKLMTFSPNEFGYLRGSFIADDGKKYSRLVHRLVLLTFVGPCPDGMDARHLNGIPGDNRLTNLAWGTPKENAADKARHGTTARGEKSNRGILTEADIVAIRSSPETNDDIAARFGVNPATISRIRSGESWSHVKAKDIGGRLPGGNRKLTTEQVDEILRSTDRQVDIAKRMGISRKTVWNIRTGRTRRKG